MNFSILILPILIALILIIAASRGVKVYETFVAGAKEGFITVYKIAPYLLTMLFAIDIFRKSGAMNYLIYIIKPVCELFNIPEGVIPMVIIKPLSGSGALGVMTDIMKTYGVDSMEGKIAAVMMGSTETIFYTLSVYFGSCQIKNTRHSLPAAMVAHIIGSIAAVYICYLVF
jgi:spore maturation protein B